MGRPSGFGVGYPLLHADTLLAGIEALTARIAEAEGYAFQNELLGDRASELIWGQKAADFRSARSLVWVAIVNALREAVAHGHAGCKEVPRA